MMRNVPLLATAFVLGGLALPHLAIGWRMPASAAEPAAARKEGIAAPPVSPAEVYARAAQAVYRSVVNIDTLQRRREIDFPFDEVTSESESEGSGVVIEDGYIVTNAHVVGRAHEKGRRIWVTLTDGRKLEGSVVGSDGATDVALLRVEAAGVPAAPLGSAKALVPGQMAIAIGNPFGLRFTVTHGVVSALGRPISGPDGQLYPDLIQHDALINPGNSGGPLVNLSGQVIGINTLVDARAQGIGFAIPIDAALEVAADLRQFGRVKRPWLGVVADTNSPYYVRRYGVADGHGVVIRGVYRNSPAAAAGLRAGDLLTEVNGQPVHTQEEFARIEKSLAIGARVNADLRRGDRRLHQTLTVSEAP